MNFLSVFTLSFNSLNSIFCRTNLNFDAFQFVIFFSLWFMVLVLILRNFCVTPDHDNCSLVFSSKNFYNFMLYLYL